MFTDGLSVPPVPSEHDGGAVPRPARHPVLGGRKRGGLRSWCRRLSKWACAVMMRAIDDGAHPTTPLSPPASLWQQDCRAIARVLEFLRGWRQEVPNGECSRSLPRDGHPTVSEARFFGFVEADVLGEPVKMASKERALLDAVDRPHLAGGLPEISRIVMKAAAEVSWRLLLEHVKRWEESALVQRLGYLLDLHEVEVPAAAKKKLLSLVNPTSKVHLGSRAEWGTSGRLNRSWGIIENVPREQLVETAVGRRRLKSFSARKS